MTPNNENSVIGQTELTEIIETEIAEHGGSISFARFMELALYHPRFGYYMSGRRRPGRGGDFITSPEATPLFGHALARQMAEFWERLGQPGQWTIREYGAGIGGLAYDILAGLSQLSESAFDSLTYRLAEVSPAMRREAESSMREAGLSHKIIVEDPAGTRLSPILGVVLANEVADAFPAIRLTLEEDGWREQHVTSGSQGFAWCSKPPSTGARSVIDMLENEGVELPVGSVVDASPAASAWFEAVAESLDRGFAMVIDYGYPAQTLYRDHRLQGTIRGYHGHTVTDDPLMRVGLQDLTAH
ncbi:MAG: class I SAM-dependent methyltransferase, partial [Thermomicrobiales bacterium]